MHPTYFINHGGGPCFFMEKGPMRRAFAELEVYLTGFAARLDPVPTAILVVSGHWETERPTVNTAPSPDLLYDYYGFPPRTYQLTWPAPGAPDLAERVLDLLAAADIDAGKTADRGWDHGVFVPLKVIFPEPTIPVLQLSLIRDLDPARHLAVGRALKPLRKEGVLIFGSGQSYQNLSTLRTGALPDPQADAFDDWLQTAMLGADSRDASLIAWAEAPGARSAQPREDHLLPLMVAAGAASGEPGSIDFSARILGKPVSGFRFG